ncbi:TPA: M23 family metallopeptidase [Vibrio harveyi]
MRHIIKRYQIYIFLLGMVVSIITPLFYSLNLDYKNLQHDNSILFSDKCRLKYSLKIKNENLEILRKELEEQKSKYAQLDARIALLQSFLIREGVNEKQIHDDREYYVEELASELTARYMLLQVIPSGSPMKYKRVSSSYGERYHPILRENKFHRGIDLTCQLGTPIIAPADGVVEMVRPSKQGYGNFIMLRHNFGFMTSYAHLSQFKVNKGEFVRKGDIIGNCGNSGNSTGPHLHYEVHFSGMLLNPRTFINWSLGDFTLLFEKEKRINWSKLFLIITRNVEQLKSTLNSQVTMK